MNQLRFRFLEKKTLTHSQKPISVAKQREQIKCVINFLYPYIKILLAVDTFYLIFQNKTMTGKMHAKLLFMQFYAEEMQ